VRGQVVHRDLKPENFLFRSAAGAEGPAALERLRDGCRQRAYASTWPETRATFGHSGKKHVPEGGDTLKLIDFGFSVRSGSGLCRKAIPADVDI